MRAHVHRVRSPGAHAINVLQAAGRSKQLAGVRRRCVAGGPLQTLHACSHHRGHALRMCALQALATNAGCNKWQPSTRSTNSSGPGCGLRLCRGGPLSPAAPPARSARAYGPSRALHGDSTAWAHGPLDAPQRTARAAPACSHRWAQVAPHSRYGRSSHAVSGKRACLGLEEIRSA